MTTPAPTATDLPLGTHNYTQHPATCALRTHPSEWTATTVEWGGQTHNVQIKQAGKVQNNEVLTTVFAVTQCTSNPDKSNGRTTFVSPGGRPEAGLHAATSDYSEHVRASASLRFGGELEHAGATPSLMLMREGEANIGWLVLSTDGDSFVLVDKRPADKWLQLN
ncbi:hypothetical protein Q5752_003274 [Cryptotrichosporon argae]